MILAKATVGVAMSAVLALGGAGAALASNSPTPSTTAKINCTDVQARVNLLAAEQVVVNDRLGLRQTALSHAKAKNNTTREQKIQDRINKVTSNQGKLSSRLQALDNACHVTPQASA
ncbi:MAG: hypothetical protein ACRD1G_09725 [Acidimicrobiales bacterium]